MLFPNELTTLQLSFIFLRIEQSCVLKMDQKRYANCLRVHQYYCVDFVLQDLIHNHESRLTLKIFSLI